MNAPPIEHNTLNVSVLNPLPAPIDPQYSPVVCTYPPEPAMYITQHGPPNADTAAGVSAASSWHVKPSKGGCEKSMLKNDPLVGPAAPHQRMLIWDTTYFKTLGGVKPPRAMAGTPQVPSGGSDPVDPPTDTKFSPSNTPGVVGGSPPESPEPSQPIRSTRDRTPKKKFFIFCSPFLRCNLTLPERGVKFSFFVS